MLEQGRGRRRAMGSWHDARQETAANWFRARGPAAKLVLMPDRGPLMNMIGSALG